MTTIGASEAKTHLPRLLKRVAKGESILITKWGKPIALLTPPPKSSVLPVAEVVQEMLAYRDRRQCNFGSLTTREMIEEGRRF